MSQTNATYDFAIGKSEKSIIHELIRKYGFSNVTWPIVLIENDRIIAYIYEINQKNTINMEMDSRPGSRSHLPSYYLNYRKTPRTYLPEAGFLSPFIADKYTCSYDYIVQSPYSSVDLDYVWYNGSYYKGFELTTFYMPFESHDRARYLISQMYKRPSWQGAGGARAFHKIVDSAEDLGVQYYIVCANTVNKVGSELKTNGYVCLFSLTHTQIGLLEEGKPPENTLYMPFSEFLNWL